MKIGTFTTRYISRIPTIADCHALRIGWARTLIGGCSMYLSIPGWVLFHLTTSTTLYHFLLRPLLGLDKVELGNYVIIDRHKIDGLAFADRVNCNFCGYANGLTTMLNEQIDTVQDRSYKLSWVKMIPLTFLIVLFTIISLVGDLLIIGLVYNALVAPLLGMGPTSAKSVLSDLKKNGYGANFNQLSRLVLLYNKSVFKRMSMLLEQIESSWCPLKHINKSDTVKYPEHHQSFYNPEELEQMRERLFKVGNSIGK